MTYLHGVEVLQVEGGVRRFETQRSNVIHLTGTAPDADDSIFADNQNVLVLNEPSLIGKLGDTGTLPLAMDQIQSQGGGAVVVHKVPEGADDAETQTNMVGGIDANGKYTGIAAAVAAQADTGLQPRIIIAPGFGGAQQLANKQIEVANKLRGFAFADGPNTDEADAIAFRANFNAKRLMIVDPQIQMRDRTGALTSFTGSAGYAGITARQDREKGFWHSPSNQPFNGIEGTDRQMVFIDGDPDTRVQLLNANEISTVFKREGWLSYGNRTTSDDSLWKYITDVRTADIINDTVLRESHVFVDQPLSAPLLRDVLESVKGYLRLLKGLGAILGFDVWLDEELNTTAVLNAGQAYINFDLTPPSPAERLTFRSHLVDKYYVNVLPLAA